MTVVQVLASLLFTFVWGLFISSGIVYLYGEWRKRRGYARRKSKR
jgi:hypothetical protein